MQREAGSHTYASLRPGFLHPIIPSYSTNPLLKHSNTHITKCLVFPHHHINPPSQHTTQIHRCLNPSHSNYPHALKSSEWLINTKVQIAIFFIPPSSTNPIPSQSHHPLWLNRSGYTLAYCCPVIWTSTTNGRNDIQVSN